MKKIISALVVILLFTAFTLSTLAATSVNGFTPYEKGGFVNGAYYPITAVAVGTDAVRLTGKGGLSWPDTANNPVADAMGAIYNEEVTLDKLNFSFGINVDMNTTTDHWYAITFANMQRLFNTWDGSDPVKCGYLVFTFDGSELKINVHNHTGGQSWNFMGNVTIPYTLGDLVSFQFKKQGIGYDLYANGSKLTFMNPADIEFTTIEWVDVLPAGKGYIATGAHVGNPDQTPYAEEYSYTVGVKKSGSSSSAAGSSSVASSSSAVSSSLPESSSSAEASSIAESSSASIADSSSASEISQDSSSEAMVSDISGSSSDTDDKPASDRSVLYILLGAGAVIIIAGIVITLLLRKRGRK
jgi:hypothetical protein